MLRRILLSLIVSVLALACNDSTGPGPRVTGTWRLQTVNGFSLPFALPDVPVNKIEITSEVITMLPSGRFTDVNTFRVTDDSRIFVETINDEGSYTVDGSTVTMTYDADGSIYTATVSGNTATLHDPEIGLTFVYRRD